MLNEQLIQYFDEYVSECKGNPIKVTDWVGKDATEVIRKKERPLTMVGFENYCFRKGYINDLKDYFQNDEGRYEDYQQACRLIKAIIFQDQIEGGMAGIYQHTLTARLNGLVEKTDNTNTNKNYEITMDLGDKSPNEDKL